MAANIVENQLFGFFLPSLFFGGVREGFVHFDGLLYFLLEAIPYVYFLYFRVYIIFKG